MGSWNNNDREESKPTYLNKIDRRLCTRTVRGWEIPQRGSFFAYGATDTSVANGALVKGGVVTEVLVTIPNDPSAAGVASSAFTARSGNTGSNYGGRGQGVTSGSDFPNYAPYFTCPFSGDGVTAGGVNSTGVSHDSFYYYPNGTTTTWGSGLTPGAGFGIQYGVDKFGVSSLGGLTGVTAYIKVVANDANFTNTLSIGLSGTFNGITLYTGKTDLNDGTKVPAAVFNTFFGATSTNDKVSEYRYDNIGVLVVAGATANGKRTVSLRVRDLVSGATGASGFTTFEMNFDRAAGLTTGGATAGGANPPRISDYFYTRKFSF